MKSKRDREEPCFVCGHYHDVRVVEGLHASDLAHRVCMGPPLMTPSPLHALRMQYEGGEPCATCGHVITQHERKHCETVLPTAIIPGFLYLGSYDTASRSEILKAMAITHILNVSLGGRCVDRVPRRSCTHLDTRRPKDGVLLLPACTIADCPHMRGTIQEHLPVPHCLLHATQLSGVF